MSLAVVRDMREARAPAGPDELVALETDVLAGFVLARAAAGMADFTIVGDVVNLEQIRALRQRPGAMPRATVRRAAHWRSSVKPGSGPRSAGRLTGACRQDEPLGSTSPGVIAGDASSNALA